MNAILTGTSGATTSIMDSILEGASKAIEFSGTCLSTMAGNPVYVFILGAGFVGIGLMLVRKLKNTAQF